LSDALSKSVDENGNSEMDIKAGLSIISDSSNNLIKFVQTYRQLSGVARPMRKSLNLKNLIDNIITLESEQIASHNARCTYSTENIDLVIFADEGQLSQIIINLIKNALQAGATQITISSGSGHNDEVWVRVANNGDPIPLSNQEQIFIPFFTTKAEGSGIGLSISRQILRQHNATIALLKSDESETVFEIIFK
jgi:signal transduction histidine kinase